MTAPTPVPVSHFDTADIDPRHRFDAWRDNIGIFFDLSMPDAAQPPANFPQNFPENFLANFHARIDVYDLGNAVFGVTASQAQRFTRDSHRVIHDNMDHILIQLFLKGGGVTSDNQHIVTGDMLIIDLDQPHDMINTDFENLTLVLPRELRPDISDMLAPLHGLKLSGDNPMIRFMAAGFLNLWDGIPAMTTDQAGSAMQSTLNLMQGCLQRENMMPDAVDTSTSIALAKIMSRYVDSNLSENLTPTSLAQTFRMSRSQIYRIFAPHGGVANYLWDRRLLRSLQLLSQHRYSHKNISTIAFECGFNSDSHFSRAFRAKFKITPSQVRADALAARNRYQANDTASSAYAAGLPNWVRRL